MGGQSLVPGGVVVDMRPLRHVDLDESGETVCAGAGALWHEVLACLNPRGRSVAVMQSNASFTVGGSLSVNCHGWQHGAPPIASTVHSFRLLLASGDVVTCSRTQHPELFALALGGYGLFGVILDATLRTVPNERYHLRRLTIPSASYADAFRQHAERDQTVGMSYGRLSVHRGLFLEEAMLNVLRRVPGDTEAGISTPLEFPEVPALTRAVFRGQTGSAYGKWLRWQLERRLPDSFLSGEVWRNQLLSEPVSVLENRSAATTDVLHEYFVPRSEFAAFLARLRQLVPAHQSDLLNVTVRDVRRDDDTFLRYASEDMFALVMLFVQARTAEGEAAMRAMTRGMIEAALDLGGRYYLPYRLHATPEHFRRAYPRADEFFARKRHYDPQLVFQNGLYRAYTSG